MLTDQEVRKIFSWQPYRDNWIVDRNRKDDNINAFYGSVIGKLTSNKLFDTYYSADGGLGNYLEFICHPKGHNTYERCAVMVCISLCAPIAAYGQTTLSKGKNSIGWGGLFSADNIGDITDTALTGIESEIKTILFQHNLSFLDKEFASRQLPEEFVESMKFENHNEGSQYLHGIFQKID